MKENDNNLEARGVSLTKKQWDRCDRLAEEYGKRSRNAFIREAVDFYCAWLEKEHIQKFLLPFLDFLPYSSVRRSHLSHCFFVRLTPLASKLLSFSFIYFSPLIFLYFFVTYKQDLLVSLPNLVFLWVSRYICCLLTPSRHFSFF